MQTVVYVLHRFPMHTDTFIRREIRTLMQQGMKVIVISVRKPTAKEVSPTIFNDWAEVTQYAFARSFPKVIFTLLISAAGSPLRFLRTLWAAARTARPGVKGGALQIVYLGEAILVAALSQKVGAVHLHNHIGDQSGTVAMLASRFSGIPYSISFHGWPVLVDAYASHLKAKVQSGSFTRSVSYFCRSQLMMFAGANSPDGYEVVRCGIEIKTYKYRPPREECSRLFCAARLSPEKGLWCLLHAVSVLKNKGRQFSLRIAGDGPIRGILEEECRSLNIEDRVHFLGYQTEDLIRKELIESDLFVLTSFYEGIPVSAMEAMAVGVPVIATNVGGTSELIESGVTGVLTPASDIGTLVSSIENLAADTSLRVRISKAGRAKVACEFDVETESRKLGRLLAYYSLPDLKT